MRPVLQSEASECGLACLAMVAAHHGKHVGLAELRVRFPGSLKGATLAQLMDMASGLGLRGQPLRAELHEIRALTCPCVLHWSLDHFVVLVRARRRRVVVFDPAVGRRELDLAALSRHFTGVVLALQPEPDFVPQAPVPRVRLRRMLGPVRGLASGLGMILLLSIGLQACVLLGPFLLQWVVDQVLVSADHDLLVLLVVGFGLLLLVQVATASVRGWAVVRWSSRWGMQWAGQVFGHLLRLPLDFFARRHLGDIHSRLGSVQAIQKTLTTSFVEAMVDGLMALATLGMMLLYSAKLATVALLAVIAYLALRSALQPRLREGTERQLVATALQQSHLLESVRGIQAIKLAGVEAFRRGAQANLLQDAVQGDIALARLGLGFGAGSQLIFGAERIASIGLGAALVMQNSFSVGMLIAYLAYKDQFAIRVGALIDRGMEFRMLRLHGERLSDIASAPAEVDHDAAGLHPAWPAATCGDATAPAAVALAARGLWYRYGAGEHWVLRDCSLQVEAGESVAIVGVSGSGKSTLLKVLLGLVMPQRGGVQVDGHDLARLHPQVYRARIGVVMQDDPLFAGSLLDNIALGQLHPDPARVEAAARAAAVHDDIAAMPMGYLSLVGDMGSTLSGGQKQRVVLARALYRQPGLLFLDEATSHLDLDCERRVGAAVRALRITRIVVAHRPETIAAADRVLALREGRLVSVS